jgi:hypothetical protein
VYLNDKLAKYGQESHAPKRVASRGDRVDDVTRDLHGLAHGPAGHIHLLKPGVRVKIKGIKMTQAGVRAFSNTS